MKSLPTSYTAARKWGIILLLALASLGAALLSMSFGSTQVPFSEILTALMGGETQAYNIVVYARLPRTLAALLCGSALAVGGVIIQGVLGNPLAGPNIIGVNAGAGLGAVLCAALIPTSMTAVPVAAFLGALGACMLVYTLARRTGPAASPWCWPGWPSAACSPPPSTRSPSCSRRPPWGQAALWWAGCLG